MAQVTFLPDEETPQELRAALAEAAKGRPFVLARLRLHFHLHDAGPMPAPALVQAYLAYLGYDASAAAALHEMAVERALQVTAQLLHYDLARDEEVILPEVARQVESLLRSTLEPWAALALTSFQIPANKTGSLVGWPSVRVVAKFDAEGGVIFVGEDQIAMLWAVDDDGPDRSIWDVSHRPRLSRK